MTAYVGLLNKDDDSAFGVHFPDLPGCFSAGDSADEAVENASTAIRLWAEDTDEVPAARSISELRLDDEFKGQIEAGAMAILVPLLSGQNSKRLNITLAVDVADAALDAAKAAGLSRSAYIERAISKAVIEDLKAAKLQHKE